MTEDENENINPESWTQRELLKHVYRELVNLKKDFDTFSHKVSDNSEMRDLESRVTRIESTEEERARSQKNTLTIIGLIFVVVNIIIAIASNVND